MTTGTLRMRIVGTAGVFVSLFVVALVRAFQLCVVEGDWLRLRATHQHQQRVDVAPERGPIVDRHGDILALTIESAAVYLRPNLFDPAQSALVARILGVPTDLIAQKASAAERFVWLRRDATPEQAHAIATLAIHGVGSEPSRRRIYPRGALAGQVVGCAGVDSQGLWGVERAYDAELRGVAESVNVERDARGHLMLRDGSSQPFTRPGARVELTVDASLQQVVDGALASAVDTTHALGGSAIVMDPSTGEILALASLPRFDPGNVTESASELARNRVISDMYEPGSTFKAIVAGAAIEAGVVRPDERLNCEGGSYTVGRRVIHDHERYGWLSFADVIKHSSNICTAKVGERLGAERLGRAIKAFGFGEAAHIDLPGEASGSVRPWRQWARIHLVTTSFGQGVSVTPLQLIRAYAAIANGGKLMRPYVVRRVLAADGTVLKENGPEVVGQPISPQTAAVVTGLLRGVVEGGTGTKAKVDGIAVAGKTGTAQKVDQRTGYYSSRDRMSSFIGYLPADAPRFIILVVVDSPRTATYGGLVAAPAFRQIAEYAVDRLGLRVAAAPYPADDTVREQLRLVSWMPADAERGMPSFLGLSMREALKQAQRAGWEVQLQGSGFVVNQVPPPGASNANGRALSLQFGSAAG